jgi:peptidoglycan/LPS O-acetylase OafA/YrhL
VSFVIAVLSQIGGVFVAGQVRPQAADMVSQLVDWFYYNLWFMQPLAPPTSNKWDGAEWTIPLEFRGSLLVFVTCMGLVKSSTIFRTAFLGGMTLYWLWYPSGDLTLFSAGMLCADLRHKYKPAADLISLELKCQTTKPTLKRNICCLAALLAVLWPLSQPTPSEGDAASLGYRTMATLIPVKYQGHQAYDMFFPCLAAIALVALLDFAEDTWIQRVYCTRFAQWLGKISFSLYLWHTTIQMAVMSRMMFMLSSIYGVDATDWRVLIVACIGCLPPLFLLSEISTAVIDRGSIKLARLMMDW